MFPSRACQIPPDVNTQSERRQNDCIKVMLLPDPRAQLSAFLTGHTSARFYGSYPNRLSFFLSFSSPPSISISVLLSEGIFFPSELYLSFFKATNRDDADLFSLWFVSVRGLLRLNAAPSAFSLSGDSVEDKLYLLMPAVADLYKLSAICVNYLTTNTAPPSC